MRFVKKEVNTTPIEDTVFVIVERPQRQRYNTVRKRS